MPVWNRSSATRHFWLRPQSIVTGSRQDDVDFYFPINSRPAFVFTDDPRGRVLFRGSPITQGMGT